MEVGFFSVLEVGFFFRLVFSPFWRLFFSLFWRLVFFSSVLELFCVFSPFWSVISTLLILFKLNFLSFIPLKGLSSDVFVTRFRFIA